MRFDVLAFDAYGTLFDVYSVTSLCESLFPGRGSSLAQLWRAKQLQYSLLRSMMGRYQDFWRVTEDALVYATKSLDLDLPATTRASLMDAYLKLSLFPDVRPGLEALKAQGARLVILSNGAPAMLTAAAKHAEILPFLEAILSADEVQTFKPDPRVYQLAASRLHVPVSTIGFVSSNPWDVSGAASAGLTAMWIQRAASDPPEELGFGAARILRSIGDLAG